LILDTSDSMQTNSNGGHTRLEWLKDSADQLVAQLDANGGVGGASGSHHVGVTKFSGNSASVVLPLGASDATAVQAAIDGLAANGNTPLKAGMAAGAADLVANGRADAQKIEIILSDGRPNPDQGPDGAWASSSSGQRPTAADGAAYLGSADIAISVALGEGGKGTSAVDLDLMALLGPDGAYHVLLGSELNGAFDNIYKQIACPSEPPSEAPSQAASEVPPSFEASVGAATDVPTQLPTEPNTATTGSAGGSGPSDSAWLLVAALGVVLASIIVMTPARSKTRR